MAPRAPASLIWCRRYRKFRRGQPVTKKSNPPRLSPRTPRKSQNDAFRTTSGPVAERFNGRISDVLKTNRLDSALDLEQTLMRYVTRNYRSPP